MSKITEMMIRKPSLKYRDVRNYEGEYYDWAAGEHLLKKGTSVHELFHPLELSTNWNPEIIIKH